MDEARADEDAKADSMTVGELVELYLADQRRRKGRDDGKHINPMLRYFGNKVATRITVKDTAAYQEWRRTGYGSNARRHTARTADSTLVRDLRRLSAALNWGIKHGHLPVGTRSVFPKPAEAPPREDHLTDAELWQLRELAAHWTTTHIKHSGRLSRIHRFVWIATFTGARKEAVQELRWDQVDFDRRVIFFQAPGTRVTKKRRPSVPIFDELMPVLRQAHAERIGPYVIDQGDIRNAWGAFIRKTPWPDLHIHDLRRSFFTMLVTNGMSLTDIAMEYQISLHVLMKHYAKYAADRGRDLQRFILPPKPKVVAA